MSTGPTSSTTVGPVSAVRSSKRLAVLGLARDGHHAAGQPPEQTLSEDPADGRREGQPDDQPAQPVTNHHGCRASAPAERVQRALRLRRQGGLWQ